MKKIEVKKRGITASAVSVMLAAAIAVIYLFSSVSGLPAGGASAASSLVGAVEAPALVSVNSVITAASDTHIEYRYFLGLNFADTYVTTNLSADYSADLSMLQQESLMLNGEFKLTFNIDGSNYRMYENTGLDFKLASAEGLLDNAEQEASLYSVNFTDEYQEINISYDDYDWFKDLTLDTVQLTFSELDVYDTATYPSTDIVKFWQLSNLSDKLTLDAEFIVREVEAPGATPEIPEESEIAGAKNYYDEDGNALLYMPDSGLVYTDSGIVYTSDSKPVIYDSASETFSVNAADANYTASREDGSNAVRPLASTASEPDESRLELIERTINGNEELYLNYDETIVSSLPALKEELFIGVVKGGTEFNPGEQFEIILQRIFIKYDWPANWIYGPGFYVYADLLGNGIALKDLVRESDLNSGKNTLITALAPALGLLFTSVDALNVSVKPYGTMKTLLEEITYYEDSLLPPPTPGEITVTTKLGTYALNPKTGEVLKDERNNNIRVDEKGFLKSLLYPIIGADARPLFIRRDLNGYVNSGGELLNYEEGGRKLLDGETVVRSVITFQADNPKNPVYLAKLNILPGAIDHATGQVSKAGIPGAYPLPVTAVNKGAGTNNMNLEFYDLNGKLVLLLELDAPIVSEADRRNTNPGEFPEDKGGIGGSGGNWWSDILGIIGGILGSGGLGGCGNGLLTILILVIVGAIVVAIVVKTK